MKLILLGALSALILLGAMFACYKIGYKQGMDDSWTPGREAVSGGYKMPI